MSIQQAHKKLGHINERGMKEISKNSGLETYGQSTFELYCMYSRKSKTEVT